MFIVGERDCLRFLRNPKYENFRWGLKIIEFSIYHYTEKSCFPNLHPCQLYTKKKCLSDKIRYTFSIKFSNKIFDDFFSKRTNSVVMPFYGFSTARQSFQILFLKLILRSKHRSTASKLIGLINRTDLTVFVKKNFLKIYLWWLKFIYFLNLWRPKINLDSE